MLREALHDTHGALASLLLIGAMLAPVVEALAGWPVHTPLGVPLAAHVAILATLVVVAAGAAARVSARRDWRAPRWLLVPPLAVAFAAILHARANAFYTASALIEGMAALFALHVGVAALHRRALRLQDPAAADRDAPRPWRRGAEWRRRLLARSLPATPSVRLAGALTVVVGWLLLVTWVLIALEHRHPAGPLLLLAGALELLALFVLVPDAFGGSSTPARPHGEWDGPNVRAPSLVRHDATGRPTPDHSTSWRH
jgi:hypothetical protein